MRDYQVYLEDILNSMNRIAEYTADLTFNQFIKNQKTVDAVERNLEIIGEATKYIPEKVRKEYPQVPWKEMAGMRDKLIHGYFGVNLEVIWKTSKDRLPAVKPLVEKALRKMDAKTKSDNSR